MQEALDRASRQFPTKLSDHEGRKGIACKLMDTAKQGQTTFRSCGIGSIVARRSIRPAGMLEQNTICPSWVRTPGPK